MSSNILRMFNNIYYIDEYIIVYKRTVLEPLFNDYIKGNITYNEYYNHDNKKLYIDMIEIYNKFYL